MKNYLDFINEYWEDTSPGTVVVPGEWYRDNVNSRNYKPFNTQIPQIVDPLLERDIDISMVLKTLKEDKNLYHIIQNTKNPHKIIDIIINKIRDII